MCSTQEYRTHESYRSSFNCFPADCGLSRANYSFSYIHGLRAGTYSSYTFVGYRATVLVGGSELLWNLRIRWLEVQKAAEVEGGKQQQMPRPESKKAIIEDDNESLSLLEAPSIPHLEVRATDTAVPLAGFGASATVASVLVALQCSLIFRHSTCADAR